MDKRIGPLLKIMRVNSRLFRNCLTGVDDEIACRRPNDKTNNIAFLGVHLIDARFFLAGKLGAKAENPIREWAEGKRGIEDFSEFPTVDELLDAWDASAKALETALASVAAETLESDAKFPFPIDDSSWLGGVAFLMQHESYHIGQLALLRKYFGLEAMRYDEIKP